jgi:hypothetical protein
VKYRAANPVPTHENAPQTRTSRRKLSPERVARATCAMRWHTVVTRSWSGARIKARAVAEIVTSTGRSMRMNTGKKLWLGSGSTVAAVSAVALMSAAPAAADTVTTVTPSTNLNDEQVVEVFDDSGIAVAPDTTADLAHVDECTNTFSGVQCMEIGTLQPNNQETANRGEYVWQGIVRVPQLLLFPSGDAVICRGDCFVRVFGSFNGGNAMQVGTDVQLSFVSPK